jgi:hypothetical protein
LQDGAQSPDGAEGEVVIDGDDEGFKRVVLFDAIYCLLVSESTVLSSKKHHIITKN